MPSVQKITFKSGLTNNILAKEKDLKCDKIQTNFTNQYGIEANFMHNSSAALANTLCLKIFDDLSKKLKLRFNLPPTIYIYERTQLLDNNSADNFCIPDTKNVIKNDYPFPGRSIFFKNFKNLEEINNIAETLHKNNVSSSPHFLAPFIHEWIHSFHLDYIYQKFGYGGNCEYLKSIYPLTKSPKTGVDILKDLETKHLSSKENQIIHNVLGQYSTLPINQYLEIFSETLTKFICNSLDNCMLIQNPFEKISKSNTEFAQIFAKICKLK